MNNVVNGNAIEAVANVFAGKNGPVLGGILGILGLVGSHERRLFQRLNLLIKHYHGSLWSNEQHERRMQYQCAVQGYRRRRDTNAYYAAMYLLTSNDDIYRRTANCFCKDGIEFGYAVLKNTSPHNYALFMAARDLCDKTEAVTMADL